MEEIAKYRTIYGSGEDRWRRYGHTNHGKKALPLVEGSSTLLDVGCGHNEFAIECRSRGIAATGVDFACPGADIVAPAQSLPFADKRYETVTAFDMLEHLRPEEVRSVLRELARVSSRFVFSISYVPSVNKVNGETLHPCVRPEAWWRDRIAEAGGQVEKTGNYLHGTWGAPKPPPVLPGQTCLMVGSGPSLLQSNLGARIDDHDQVVRFNRYETFGYELDTGAKTTLWSTFGRGYLPGEHEPRPDRIIYIHGDSGNPALDANELWRIPASFFAQLRERVVAVSLRDDAGKERTIPTSGLLVAAWLLEWIEIDTPLAIAGFDHFRKSRIKGDVQNRHHYWHDHSSGRPPEHDGDAEAVIFEKWEAEGKVCRLPLHRTQDP